MHNQRTPETRPVKNGGYTTYIEYNPAHLLEGCAALIAKHKALRLAEHGKILVVGHFYVVVCRVRDVKVHS